MLARTPPPKTLLGSVADKPSKNFSKTLNVAEYSESYVQNIEAPRADDPII